MGGTTPKTTSCDYSEAHELTTNYFEPILVLVAGDFSGQLPDGISSEVARGEITYAGFLDYLNRKQTSAQIEIAIDATVTTASMTFGVGEIYLAIRAGAGAGRIAIISWELGNEIIDAYMHTEAFETWCKNNSEACITFKKASMISQLAGMGVAGIDIANNWDVIKGARVANTGSDLTSYVNSLMNKNIRNSILDLTESRVIAQKYFNRINQNPTNYLSDYTLHIDDFETWYSNVFKSNLFEAHHIIPKNVLRDNANLQNILDWARNNNKYWDFGDIDNGIMLQKRRKNISGEVVGDHANHPNYDTQITQKIDDIFNQSNGNMPDAFDDLIDFVDDLKLLLNTDVVEGSQIVNTITIP